MSIKKTPDTQPKDKEPLKTPNPEKNENEIRKKEGEGSTGEKHLTEQKQQKEEPSKKQQDQEINERLKPEQHEDKKYENASTCFEVAKSEYENEKTRTNTIDSKIAIVTAIVTAVLLIIAETTNFDSLFNRTVDNVKSIVSVSILLGLVFGSIILISIALVMLAITIITRKYKVLDSRWFAQVENLNEEKSIYYLNGAEKYILCCEENRRVNEQRCKRYDCSVRLLTIGFILFLLFFVLKFFL